MTIMATNPPKHNEGLINHIYDIVNMIPFGKVTSYGAIAKAIGLKSGARWVGWAMNQSHLIPGIPAHRVVNSQGLLTGKDHFGTPTKMAELLANEGIQVNNNKVVDIKNVFWDPMTNI